MSNSVTESDTASLQQFSAILRSEISRFVSFRGCALRALKNVSIGGRIH